jgi:hypothetical protein
VCNDKLLELLQTNFKHWFDTTPKKLETARTTEALSFGILPLTHYWNKITSLSEDYKRRHARVLYLFARAHGADEMDDVVVFLKNKFE